MLIGINRFIRIYVDVNFIQYIHVYTVYCRIYLKHILNARN